MKHRIIYDQNKVIAAVEHSGNTVTSSNENFIIDDPVNAINFLSNAGVDFSYLWKEGLVDRIVPTEEIAISDHPNDAGIARKVFVHSMPINQIDKFFWVNLIVRHFNSEDIHLNAPDDQMVTIKTDNSEQIEGVGEYDYYKNLIENGASIFDLQAAQIPIMDNLGRFGLQIYD